MSEFVRVCEALAKQGFDFQKFVYMKSGVNKTLADVEQECPGINIAKVLEETGVELEYELGFRKNECCTGGQWNRRLPNNGKGKTKAYRIRRSKFRNKRKCNFGVRASMRSISKARIRFW